MSVCFLDSEWCTPHIYNPHRLDLGKQFTQQRLARVADVAAFLARDAPVQLHFKHARHPLKLFELAGVGRPSPLEPP